MNGERQIKMQIKGEYYIASRITQVILTKL